MVYTTERPVEDYVVKKGTDKFFTMKAVLHFPIREPLQGYLSIFSGIPSLSFVYTEWDGLCYRLLNPFSVREYGLPSPCCVQILTVPPLYRLIKENPEKNPERIQTVFTPFPELD